LKKITIFGLYLAIAWKCYKTGLKLLWNINREHMTVRSQLSRAIANDHKWLWKVVLAQKALQSNYLKKWLH